MDQLPLPPTPADVGVAAAHLTAHLAPTPLQLSGRLSAEFGRPVYLKREDLQPVRSYKVRGAFWAVVSQASRAPADRPVRSVVCASAGNHAQGVVWACRQLGLEAVVVLPARTPRQKRDRIAALGDGCVTVISVPGLYDDAAAAAGALAADTGATLVPPFDDPFVVAGQGTVALEAHAQLSALTDEAATMVVPVGGGGLAAGCRVALAASGWDLLWVEPAGAACLHAALAHGSPVDLATVDPFVDGAAVRRAGNLTTRILASGTSDVAARGCVVDEGDVATAVVELYQCDGIVAEPAGALSLAALRAAPPAGDRPVVLVISGGNNDLSRYGEILERSLVAQGLRHYFLVEFPQVPGSLRRFLDEVLAPGDDIVHFEYVKRSDRETGPALVGIEIAHRDDLPALSARLAASPLTVTPVPSSSPLARFLR